MGEDGYGVGELQNEYNALSSQGILAGTVVTLPQLAGAFLLVAGTVTSQNLLFQMREVLMFCISGKEMGAPTGNWLYDSARDLTEMASMQFAV